VRRLPIRLRVTAAFALAMAAVLAGSGLFLYLRLSAHLALALDRELRLRAQDLTALVSQPHASLAGDGTSRFVERGESYAQLVSPSGRVLDATRPLGDRALITGSRLAEARARPIYLDRGTVPGLDEPSRILATAVSRNGRRAVLLVGATRQDDVETLASFRDELLVAGPVALLLASCAGYVLAGLSLRQVEAMRRRAAAVSASRPGKRLPVPATGDELQRLGETLNEMLGRLEAALERERRLVADAGHELRTPLALLRTELELALRQARTAGELRQAVRSSSHEVERLAQLAEDILLVAQADDGELPLRLQPVAVDRMLSSVVSRFEWRANEVGKTVDFTPSGLWCRGDELRLEQALANLVDNALRHGGFHVEVDAVAYNATVELHVRDDGDGLPDAFAARAFDRFARADEARHGDGAGLGLAIVQRIAEAHGGAAHVARRQPAGTDAWIAVPASDGR